MLTLALLAFSLTTPAFAQAPDAQVDLAEEADLHFLLGVEAYRASDYRVALDHMLQSNRLAPNKNVLFNIARCYGKLEQYDEAYRSYATYLQLEDDASRQQDARDALAELADRVALVEVTSDPPGAQVFVDRRDLGARGVTPLTLALPPGDHVLFLEADGYRSGEADVTVVTGSTAERSATLERILATVQVTGEPAGATIRNEESGETLGTLPGAVLLPPEPAVLLVSSEGFATQKVLVNPTLDEERSVDVQLAAKTGQVEFLATQRGARIELDGELVGFTPSLVDVPIGAHDVVITLEGYEPFSDRVVIEEGDRQTLQAPMVPSQQVVTGSGVAESVLDAPASIVVISEDDIRDRGYDSLAEVLHDLPGFDNMTVNGTMYQHSYQRGYRTPFTQRTLLLIDGRVDNHLWSQMANLSRQYPITMIERIEVLYGPASAVYGANAFLGIINVVTKKGGGERSGTTDGTVRASYGSFQSQAVDGTVTGTAGDQVRYAASFRYFSSQEADLSGRWGFVDNADLKNTDIWGPLAVDVAAQDIAADAQNSYGKRYSDGYQDPTQNWGAHGSVGLGALEIGALAWDRTEGYGPYYASDAGHPAAQWSYSSQQLYARHSASLADNLTLNTSAGWRRSVVYGDWAESFYGGGTRSLSTTNWLSDSQAYNLEANIGWTPNDRLQVLGGMRFEHEVLQKAYQIPDYYGEGYYWIYDEASDSWADTDGNPVDPVDDYGAFANGRLPNGLRDPSNTQPINDVGAFLQAIVDLDKVRLNAGVRVDHNSFFHDELFTDSSPLDNCSWSEDPQPGLPTDNGSNPPCDFRRSAAVNPRASVIYKPTDSSALKLLYGEAFQEPAGLQVWGGWTGRNANESLVPEKARNLEAVAMLRTARTTQEVSAYAAFYDNVIKEEAENAGERQVLGLEYRATTSLPNPIPDSDDVRGFANYTVTQTTSSLSYNHNTGLWEDESTSLGDIAPHKANVGLTVPVMNWVRVHNRLNVISAREPYTRNALRADDYTFAPYALWHANVSVGTDAVRVGLRVLNILDTEYLVPGGESAGAGQNFAQPSLGFHNSAVPVAGRSLYGTAEVRF